MPKNVQMPDGSVIAFPDSMDDATIHAEGLKYVQQAQQKQPTRPLGVSMMGPSNPGRVPDSVIDMLRPLLAGAGASGAAALSGPAAPATGPAAYLGIDALLQQLKEKRDRGMAAGAMNLEPGGAAATLTNSAEQFGLGKIGDKLISKGVNAVKAFRNVDQPELMKLLPTTSQALEGSGYGKLASVTKSVEDLALGVKNKALNRTAGAGFAEALDLAKKNEMNVFTNPQEALAAARQDIPFGEGSLTPVRFTDQGRGFTPITVKPNTVPVTPVSIKSKSNEPWTIQREDPYARTVTRTKVDLNEGQTEVIPGQTKQVPEGTYRTIPGEQKTLPGGQIQAQYGEPKINTAADSLAALDKVIADPKKLQDTLSRAAELGTGDNLRKTLAGYKFSDIMNKAATRDVQGNVTKLNPQIIANEWADPAVQDSLKTLYNSQQRADIDQFFKNITTTQDKLNSSGYRKLWLMEGGVGLGTGLLTGNPIHGAGGVAGVYVGSQVLARLLTNPKTARIAVALAGNEPLGVSDQFAGRLLTRALQGSTVALINNDGSKTPGTFGSSGFEPASH